MFCNQRVQSGERKISEIYENPIAQHSGQWVRWEFLLDQVEKQRAAKGHNYGWTLFIFSRAYQRTFYRQLMPNSWNLLVCTLTETLELKSHGIYIRLNMVPYTLVAPLSFPHTLQKKDFVPFPMLEGGIPFWTWPSHPVLAGHHRKDSSAESGFCTSSLIFFMNLWFCGLLLDLHTFLCY